MADGGQSTLERLYKHIYPAVKMTPTGGTLPRPDELQKGSDDTEWFDFDETMDMFRAKGAEVNDEFMERFIMDNRRRFYAGETTKFVSTAGKDHLPEAVKKAGNSRPMDWGESLAKGAVGGLSGNYVDMAEMGDAYVPDDFVSKAAESAGHVGGMIAGPVKGLTALGTVAKAGRLAAPLAFGAYGGASKADSAGERGVNAMYNLLLAGGLHVLPKALVGVAGKLGGPRAGEAVVSALKNPAGRGAYDLGVFSGLGVGEKLATGQDINFVDDVLPQAVGGALGVGAVAPGRADKNWLKDVEPYKLDIGLEETRHVKPADWARRVRESHQKHTMSFKEFKQQVLEQTNAPIEGLPATELTAKYIKSPDMRFDEFTADVLKNKDLLTGNLKQEHLDKATYDVLSDAKLKALKIEVEAGEKEWADVDRELLEFDEKIASGDNTKWDADVFGIYVENKGRITRRAKVLSAPKKLLSAIKRGEIQEMRTAEPNFPDPLRYFQGIGGRRQFSEIAKHLNWESKEWETAGIKVEREIKAETTGIFKRHGIKTAAQREDISALLLDESGALSDQVPPEILDAAAEMRPLLDRIFTAQNHINEALDQPIVDYRAEYMAKIRKPPRRLNIIGRMRESAREKPTDVLAGIKPPKKYTSPREREQGIEDYEREMDAGKLMDIIASDTGKKLSYSPIVKSNHFIADVIQEKGFPTSAEGIRNVTGHRYQGIPMGISGFISNKMRPYRAGRVIDEGAGWFKKKFNNAKYLGNALFSLVTQTASMQLAAAKYPGSALGGPAQGIYDQFSPTMRAIYDRGYAGLRKGQTGMRQEGTMDAPGAASIVPRRRVAEVKDVTQRWLLEEVERHTGIASTGIALRVAYKRGYSPRVAGPFAAEFVGKTQSFYDPINRAAILSSRPLNAAIPAQGYLVELRNWMVEELGSMAKAEIGVDEGKSSGERIATVALLVGMWQAWRQARKEFTGYMPSIAGQVPFLGPVSGESPTYLPEQVVDDGMEAFRLLSKGRYAEAAAKAAGPYTDSGLALERGVKAVEAHRRGELPAAELPLAIPFGKGATPTGYKKRKKADKDIHPIEITRGFGGDTEIEFNYRLWLDKALEELGADTDEEKSHGKQRGGGRR